MLFNENKKISELKNNSNKLTFENVNIHKNLVIGENKTSILVRIPHFCDEVQPFKFWLKKSFVFASVYSNNLKTSICTKEDFEYSLYCDTEINDWKKPDTKVSGKKLAEIIEAFNTVIKKKKL